MADEALGPWTEELQELFGQTEEEYWEEQAALHSEMSIEFFGKSPIGTEGPLRNGDSFDKVSESYFPKTKAGRDAALSKAIDEALDESEKQREKEDKELDEAVEKAMKEEEDKKKQREKEELDAVEGDDDDDPSTPTEDELEGDDDDDPSTPNEDIEGDDDDDPSTPVGGGAGMPTEGDDNVGVVRKFWGGDGPSDPLDNADSRKSVRVQGGDAPLDPWDQYDGVSGRPGLYGGDEPTLPWEKIGPKFRPLWIEQSQRQYGMSDQVKIAMIAAVTVLAAMTLYLLFLSFHPSNVSMLGGD